MKRATFVLILAALIASAGRVGLAHQSNATVPAMGSPMASPAAVATGAAFLTIVNRGAHDDELKSATSSISAAVDIHETKSDGGVMKMHPVDEVDIHAGETVVFKPGGYHFMLVGLTQDLTPGMNFTLTLTFERAGTVTFPVMVRELTGAAPANATPPAAVSIGDLVIDQAWARPAPSMNGAATPVMATHGQDENHDGNSHQPDGTAESH